jgi:hypothetical protein
MYFFDYDFIANETINLRTDRLLLMPDIDCVYEWCSTNFTKPKFTRIGVTSLRKCMCQIIITDWETMLYCEETVLRIWVYVHFIFFYIMKLLVLIYRTSFSFSKICILLKLHFVLVRFLLDYEYINWNSITIADYNELECVQGKFVTLCHNKFF